MTSESDLDIADIGDEVSLHVSRRPQNMVAFSQ